MGKPCRCMQFIKKLYFVLQVTQESIPVLQVTQESVSGTASQRAAFEHAMKSKVCMIKSLPTYYQAIPETIKKATNSYFSV